MEGCDPEISALNNKCNFMPNGFMAENLQFKGVNKVNIAGPWDQKESLIREIDSISGHILFNPTNSRYINQGKDTT